jgi:hypothetical protein
MANILYFSGTTQLKNVYGLENKKFERIGGIRSKHNRWDGYSRAAGHPTEGADALLPVTRTIEYKANGSKHKCDARCRSA